MIDDVAGDERNRHFCMRPLKMSSSNRLGSSGFIYLSFIIVKDHCRSTIDMLLVCSETRRTFVLEY